MGMTVEQLLNELEKPENEEKIQHLEHLENLDNLNELREIRGIARPFIKLALKLTNKHMAGIMELSKCKTVEDIAAFRQTEHFDKIKATQVLDNLSLKDLEHLKELENLKELEKLKDSFGE